MSFGLTNTAAAFMDFMNRVFLNYLDSFVIVFIGDIFVYSKSDDEHMGNLRIVLQVFKEHQLTARYSMCELWLRSVTFLGHIVSSVGTEVDPKKKEVVKNWPRLLTPTDIQSFLDLAGCYRRLVDRF